jgi:hypothetical protein
MAALRIALGVLLIIAGVLVPIFFYRPKMIEKTTNTAITSGRLYRGKVIVYAWIFPFYVAAGLIVLGIYLLV